MSSASQESKLSLLHRAWRFLPPEARRTALRGTAMALAPRRDAAAPASSQGVVIGGEMARVSGLGEAARLLHAGCGVAGADRGSVVLDLLRQPSPPVLPDGTALILHVNAPTIPLMLARAPRHFLRGRRVIGFWNWELPLLPESWRAGGAYVHEIWTPSAFTQAALTAMFPGIVRLVPYPLAALPLPPAKLGRAALDLPRDAVITTVIANLGASFARKNPLAAVAAHRIAFGGRQDRILVLKLAGGAAFPADLARIRAAAADSANIRVIDAIWPGARIHDLIAASDIVLSLHRAEGFGLVPAEAMLRGIAVAATGWSGNLQFMNAESAALVPYRLTAIEDARGDYDVSGAIWAEPDIEAAASLLRALADNPARRAVLGARGRVHAQAALGAGPLEAALDAAGIIR